MNSSFENFEIGGMSFQGEKLFHEKIGYAGDGGREVSLEWAAWLVRSSNPEADKNAVIIQTPTGVTRLRTEGNYKYEAVNIIGWPANVLKSVYPVDGLFTEAAVEVAKERGFDKYRDVEDWIKSVS